MGAIFDEWFEHVKNYHDLYCDINIKNTSYLFLYGDYFMWYYMVYYSKKNLKNREFSHFWKGNKNHWINCFLFNINKGVSLIKKL